MTKNIIEGLKTLAPFYNNIDGYTVGAEHDQIYSYATDKALDDVTINLMISLGWIQEYNGLDYNKDFSIEDYREYESWIYYV